MAPLNPTTGQVLLQTANALSQTLQFQQQMAQRQQAQEETHQIQVANLKAKNEANELKLTLDKLKVESEQLGLREQTARTTKLEAEASLIERLGPVEAARAIAAAQAAGRGGRSGNINFSEVVSNAVGRGATRAMSADIKGSGDLSTKIATIGNLTQLEDGRTVMKTPLNTGLSGRIREATIDVDTHLRKLGIRNPADLAEVAEVKSSLVKQANELTDLTKFEGLAPGERARQERELRERIAVADMVMGWSFENGLSRSTDALLQLSGDAEILNLKQLADNEPSLSRTAAIADMPGTMSNQAKDHFYTQFADPEANVQDVATAIRQHYPKTAEGAIDFESPEVAAISRRLLQIHGQKFIDDLSQLLIR